jgi:signal transduction protein with GAF and PtsI domain
MSVSEPTMIGLSEKAHALLSQMKEDNFLAEMADGYRLAIGLALAQGIAPDDVPQRRTVFSVATIDPDQEIAAAIKALIDLKGGSVYRMAERLADWGVIELAKRFDGGPIDVATLVPKSD